MTTKTTKKPTKKTSTRKVEVKKQDRYERLLSKVKSCLDRVKATLSEPNLISLSLYVLVVITISNLIVFML